MKLVFCGTPEFAVPALRAVLAAGHEVALVVSQPDRPVGRAAVMTAPAVKRAALENSLRVVQPEKIKNNLEFRAELESIAPDVIVIVAYGRIVPKWMLDLPRLGNINVHGSLLPKYRGAAPIQWAIARGESLTGVTTMRIDEGLDTGDILLQREVRIGPDDTSVDLFPRLAEAGAHLLVETLAGLAADTMAAHPQNHGDATLAPILTREDALVDFTQPASVLYDRWRGFQPWPGAYSFLQGKKLTLHRIAPAGASTRSPGEVLIDQQRCFVACGEHSQLELLELQIEGRKRMPAEYFLRGAGLKTGDRLG
jgi:methionyl-tRNA formyltransferase